MLSHGLRGTSIDCVSAKRLDQKRISILPQLLEISCAKLGEPLMRKILSFFTAAACLFVPAHASLVIDLDTLPSFPVPDVGLVDGDTFSVIGTLQGECANSGAGIVCTGISETDRLIFDLEEGFEITAVSTFLSSVSGLASTLFLNVSAPDPSNDFTRNIASNTSQTFDRLLDAPLFGNNINILARLSPDASTEIGTYELAYRFEFLVEAVAVSEVPLPAAAWFMLSGLGVFAATRRRLVDRSIRSLHLQFLLAHLAFSH